MITEGIFKRSRPDFSKLEQFGFRPAEDPGDAGTAGAAGNGVLRYSEILQDIEFRAELDVTETGRLIGRVIDPDTGEEYLPIRVEGQIGGFVGHVRELYQAFLERIREACFIPVSFMYDQSNRIEGWIHSTFGVTAEFPWEKYPGNGTFKCVENGKWFAAVLTVEYGKLEPAGAPDAHDADTIVEVINLKAAPDDIPALTEKPGIYHAWHMNKKHWISVILDDTVPDEEVISLIRASYALVSSGKGKSGPAAARADGAWMIPSNPSYYDVDAGFRGGRGEIEWHQHTKVRAGDEVYIYCSAPYSAILYRCKVVAADLPYHGMFRESKGYEKSMRIRLIEKYPPDKYPLSFMKEHGGSAVRGARSMPAELLKAIRETR